MRNLVPKTTVMEVPTAERQANGHPKIGVKHHDAHLRLVIVQSKRRRRTAAASGTCGSFDTPASAQFVQKKTTEK